MKAIGYVRWSSDDQSAGNSLERQTENVESYCQRNKLELTETLVDDGFSAFKGAHLTKGKFGHFLTVADKGRYRGYALVTEAIDRLSRLGTAETWRLTDRLLNDGLEIHVTQQNRVVRSLDDLPTVIMQAVESFAAAEYSKKISERIGSAWRAKKRSAKNGISITARLPGWLEGKVGEKIRVNEAKAKILRQIFQWTAEGLGKRIVARRLNEQRVPTFGGGRYKAGYWRSSYIDKLLHNRAVIGEYQPMRGAGRDRKPDGEPRIGFFPAVIDPALFLKAQASIASRRKYKVAGRIADAHNLFSGLIWDVTNPNDPARMHYRHRAVARLTTDRPNGVKPNSLRYDLVELGFTQYLDMLDWESILDATESADIKQAEQEIAQLNLDIERAEAQAQKAIDALLDTPSKLLKERLSKLEAEIERDKAYKATAEKKLEDLKRKNDDLLDRGVIYSKLAKATDLETRRRLRQEIQRKVTAIELNFRDKPFITGVLDKFERRHGNEAVSFIGDYRDWVKRMREVTCVIRFTNGVERRLLFQTGFPGGVYRMVIVEAGEGYRATWLKPKRTSAGKPPQAPLKGASVGI